MFRLFRIVQLALMANRQHANDVEVGDEAVEGDVAAFAERDYKLSNFALDAPTDQRIGGKCRHRRPDGRGCIESGRRVVLSEKFKRALEMRKRTGGINYRRHALGRGAFFPFARRSSQACTSSAR